MLKSLYAILNPLLEQGKEGKLKLTHEDGRTATIVIKQGELLYIKKGSQQGVQALKEVALWLFFLYEFIEEPINSANTSAGVDIAKYLLQLKKIDEKSTEIQATIPLENHSFLMSADNFEGVRNFKPDELKVALALDGRTPIKSIIKKTKITDLVALVYLLKLYKLGLAKVVELKDALLESEKAVFFMESLIEAVTDYLGPAADLVVDEAFESFESTPERIYKNELTDLTVAVASQLDGANSLSFKKWSQEMIKKL